MQLPVAPTGAVNSNSYSYVYDAGQRLVEIDDNLGHANTFSYQDNNWLSGQHSANGLSAAFTRNVLGQGTDLLNIFTSGGGTTSGVSEFGSLGYDGVGNETAVTATVAASSTLSGSLTFGYDSKDQLTGETSSASGAGVSNSFAYDSAGNATTFRGGASRSFNSSNQFSGTGFVYDNNGNPTTYAGSTCVFDIFNRATSLGTALTAGYRSDGLRAWKQDSEGNKTYYLYDGVSPLCEMDASGNWKGEYLYGPAGLISHSRASLGTVFFAYDERGNVQSVLSSSGALISSRVYDAYGSQVGGIVADSTHDDPAIGYNGQCGYITDAETGLILCGHRYYDPSAGRWLTRDPIGYGGGIGLYNYCANNPVMGVDTSGFQTGNPEADQILDTEIIPVLEVCPAVVAAEDAVDNAANSALNNINQIIEGHGGEPRPIPPSTSAQPFTVPPNTTVTALPPNTNIIEATARAVGSFVRGGGLQSHQMLPMPLSGTVLVKPCLIIQSVKSLAWGQTSYKQ